MLFYPALILTAACVLLLCFKTRNGILLTLISKPVIDTTWDDTFIGLKLAYIIGVVVPIVIIVKFFIYHRQHKYVPLLWLWLIYVGYNFLAAQMIIYFDPKEGFETFFKVLNGLGGYLMFLCYFDNPSDFKKLVAAMLIAGLFPIGIGLYQFATGHVWRIHSVILGEHVRNVGLYHNMINLKYFIFQTYAAIFLYWSYFVDRSITLKAFLVIYFFCSTIVLYKCYTKAGYFEFGLWILLWFLFRRNYLMLVLAIICSALIFVYMSSDISEAIKDLYSKDYNYFVGQGDVTQTFGGRYFIWADFFKRWNELPFLLKIFGTGTSGVGVHNDHFFALIRSGILGWILYVGLLSSIGILLVKKLLSHNTECSILALILFLTWNIEAVGLVPSAYPHFQWFTLGFVGLLLSKKSNLGFRKNIKSKKALG